jgi:hypothetical protein
MTLDKTSGRRGGFRTDAPSNRDNPRQDMVRRASCLPFGTPESDAGASMGVAYAVMTTRNPRPGGIAPPETPCYLFESESVSDAALPISDEFIFFRVRIGAWSDYP